ncbi:MAG: Elongation factor Ts [candidate division TM6 bacterium GW2011_GWF2_32_72]|nr:MAG: Elongation factor Ts [candidate division TM6 bacterium GW2011_GWF2_32_72]
MANITMEQIQELRGRTGVGMMDCKKALVESNGDMEKALEILRKKGASIAAKRSGNATEQGIIHSYIHPGAQVGVLIEVVCETDFVAKTDDMKNFAADVCMQIAALKPKYLAPEDVDAAFIEKEKAILKEELIKSGKPEKMVDQIVEGKLGKIYAEICLIKQTYVKDDKLTIEDLLKGLIAKLGESIKIKRFVRFEIGAE